MQCNVKPKIHVGEPINVNPCSPESNTTCFRGIGRQAGVKAYGGELKWLVIECDGLPYINGLKTIKDLHICNTCRASIMGITGCLKHTQTKQISQIPLSPLSSIWYSFNLAQDTSR